MIEEKHLQDICKFGQKEKCCRYISLGAGGFICAKLNPGMKAQLDEEFEEKLKELADAKRIL